MLPNKVENILGEDWYEIPIEHCRDYLIDQHGRVYSKRRKYTRSWKGKTITQTVGGKILKPALHKEGYTMYTMTLDRKKKTFYGHELVAVTFIGSRPEGNHICHCDGNPSNNHYTNLRYDTPKGNAEDRHLHGTDAIGENNPRNKYNEETIAHIKYLLFVENLTQRQVADYFDIPYPTIGDLKQKRRWSHIRPRKPDQ